MKTLKYSTRTFIQGFNKALDENVTGKVVIRVRWNSGKGEVNFFSGYYAESYKWNTEEQQAIRNTTHANSKGVKVSAAEINGKVRNICEAIDKAFSAFSLADMKASDVTATALKDEVYSRLGLDFDDILKRKVRAREDVRDIKAFKDKQKGFFDYIEDFIEEGLAGGWRKDTVKKHRTLYNRLKDFEIKRRINLSFAMLDEDVLFSFQQYLLSEGYRNVSVNKMIKDLRWFFRWAEKKSLISDRNVIDYRTKLKDVENKTVVFLTWDEFQKIYQYQPEKKHLERVKDVFVFQCATGLRYADLYALKRNQIDGDTISVVTSKTANHTRIDFNRYSREVYDKYIDCAFEDNKALPVLSNQKYNDFLKVLCKEAGITSKITIAYKQGGKTVTNECEKWEKISSHSGRRTFVSLSLYLGATPEEVMKISGHHSYDMMQRYIGLNEEQRKHATGVWDERTEKDKYITRLKEMPLSDIREMFSVWERHQKHI